MSSGPLRECVCVFIRFDNGSILRMAQRDIRGRSCANSFSKTFGHLRHFQFSNQHHHIFYLVYCLHIMQKGTRKKYTGYGFVVICTSNFHNGQRKHCQSVLVFVGLELGELALTVLEDCESNPHLFDAVVGPHARRSTLNECSRPGYHVETRLRCHYCRHCCHHRHQGGQR